MLCSRFISFSRVVAAFFGSNDIIKSNTPVVNLYSECYIFNWLDRMQGTDCRRTSLSLYNV